MDCNWDGGNGEGSQALGGVDVEPPDFRFDCECLESLYQIHLDQLVETDVQMEDAAQLMLRLHRHSNECFLDFEDYGLLDIDCL